MSDTLRILFIGGGAAGFFGALRAAEVARKHQIKAKVAIFEASGSFLKKVKISGGGRCNVTHHLFEVKDFAKNYPRGQRELISALHRFQAQDMVNWLKERGVDTKVEEDGRMFPVTDSSQTIIDCYIQQADRFQVDTLYHHAVQAVEKTDVGFRIKVKDKGDFYFDKVMVCTGSSPAGYRISQELGHTITERAPSLFSFKIKSPLLSELSGLSFPSSEIQLQTEPKSKFTEKGPLLITHWGLSGPAILKLSAWAAREMKQINYQAQLKVNWLGLSLPEVTHLIKGLKESSLRSLLKNTYPKELPKRFWLNLLSFCEIAEDLRWSDISKKQMRNLEQNIYRTHLEILGQNRFKEEFVECGGVDLKEIDFKTMQSKKHKGLYYAGEVLDVDGITGGFNFQNAWTGAWIAGEHMVLNS